MKSSFVQVPIFTHTVENHQEVKHELLSLIDETKSLPIVNQDDNIQLTDWSTPVEIERPYFSKMIEVISPALSAFTNEINAARVSIESYWFQQYGNDGRHRLHTHPNSMYGLVYYVELPEKAQPTNFMTANGNFVPEAKEGDIVLFPSILFHSSPENKDFDRKTVLVANLNYE